jgi:uncharacterized protein (DUF58 family)
MVDVRLLDPTDARPGPQHPLAALDLARRLPSLVVAAKDVAATVMHGVHGRRRAGVGETFWQFRPFTLGESTGQIDWRRSARDDRVYVREREWEAAHTVWIWMDRSPSMAYASSLARQPKIDRALTLGMAAADLLVRGGERVGIPGLTRALANRNIVDRFAEAMVEEASRPGHVPAELPPAVPLAPRTQAVLVGDFLSDAADLTATIHAMASRGALGHLVMVTDPVEETFPFAGHTELVDVDSPARLRLGDAESLRDLYVARLAAHRDAIRRACSSRGWTFTVHRTDRPASEALLALRMVLETGFGTAAPLGSS